MAAVAASREGKAACLLSATAAIGGMTAGGLGQTDIGNSEVVGGLAAEFFANICAVYGKPGKGCYQYEPHVAEGVFRSMLSNASVTLVLNAPLFDVQKTGAQIVSLRTATSVAALISGDARAPVDGLEYSAIAQSALPSSALTTYTAKVFVDASYEGDLVAAAGVSYTVGRESSSTYNESLGGRTFVPNKVGGHQFAVPLNYTDASGKLLPMIYTGDAGEVGQADVKVQSYNYRLCLTHNKSNQLPLPAPAAYDPAYWELFRRYLAATGITSFGSLIGCSTMPNEKTDCNNNGAISTDFIGGAWAYPDGGAATRAQVTDAHTQYTLGFLHFLATDAAVPAALRAEVAAYGLAADEFPATGGWPPLYVREGRRMVSDFVFTQNDRQFFRLNRTGSIGLYSYNIDTHHAQRIPQGDYVRNEGDIEAFGGLGPGQMPYPMVVPRRAQATNLLVPVACSASHMGFGAIRLEPQWMILGQSAGVAAATAATSGVAVQDVNVPALQAQLKKLGQLLDWPLAG